MMKALIAISSVCAATFLGGAGAEAHSRYYRHSYGEYRAYRHAGYRHHGHRPWHRAVDEGGELAFSQGQTTLASAGGTSAGLASWYRGRTGGLTAAHRCARVLVTNRANGRSVVVRIDDRGPFVHGRVIDLNRPSAVAIGVTGVSPVTIERL